MTVLLRYFFAFFLIGGGILVGWCFIRPLPLPAPAVLTEHGALPAFEQRYIQHVTLHAESIGDIGLAISMPVEQPAEKMPIVMVLGGLGTGENNIRYITNAGNNIIVGYDWAMPVKPPSGFSFVFRIPAFYGGAVYAPAQIASAIDWLSQQPWADATRISILGYSLGALAAPAAQKLSQDAGHNIGWTILAYGGAPLGDIFAGDKYIRPDWMRVMMTPFVDLVFHPMEPDLYLSNLHGQFLVLEGKNDGLIPESAREKLRDDVPEPKTVIDFEGDHMGVGADKQELLEKIIASSRIWLLSKGAVNPL